MAITPMTSGLFEAKEFKHNNMFLQIVCCPIQAELVLDCLPFCFSDLT